MTTLLHDLAERGINTKRWKTKAGQPKGGRVFERNALYKLLNNRIYTGEIFYDNDWHVGDFEPIVPPKLWSQVHALMKSEGVPNFV